MSDNIISFSITPQNNQPLFNFPNEESKNKIKQFTISHNCVKKKPKMNLIQNHSNYFKIDNPTCIPKTPKLHKKIQNSEFSEGKKIIIKRSNSEKIDNINESQNSNQISIKENENSINTNSNKISNNEFQSGRWTDLEHQKFIEGILEYGNEWKRVQGVIKTRSSTQARSHAQKFFLRIKKNVKNPLVWNDQEQLLDYIINSNVELTNRKPLTDIQKERLLSAIRSNLKPDEKISKKFQKENNKNSDLIVEENEEEEDEKDNLGYNKEEDLKNLRKNSAKFSFISDYNEKQNQRKMTFCSKKRKNSSNYSMNIFDIKKDFKHKLSMEISQPNLNKLANNYSNNSNNINLNNTNNANEENMKQDNYTNTENNLMGVCYGKERCFNCGNYGCWGNNGGNYIINNNFINITNNYNNCHNSSNNCNIAPYFINNTFNNQNNQNFLCNDSINSDILNNNSFNCPKFYNNNIYHNNENNCNLIYNNMFEDDNNINKNIEGEGNDPFKLEFDRIINMDNNNYSNMNMNMESHIGEERVYDEDEFLKVNLIKNNNDITYEE